MRKNLLYKEKTKLGNVVLLLFALLITQMAGVIGSMFTTPVVDTWYAGLLKPYFTPPDWFFGPVWIVLFLLMGVSLYLVLHEISNNKKASRLGLWFFGIQLVLNTAWSIIFFGLQNPMAAAIELIVLLVFILLTIWQFSKVSLTAGWLLIPYAVWVTFAGVLNYWIWLVN